MACSAAQRERRCSSRCSRMYRTMMITTSCVTSMTRRPACSRASESQQRAEAQRDVDPALAAGRPVVELAESRADGPPPPGNGRRSPLVVSRSIDPRSRSRSRSSRTTSRSSSPPEAPPPPCRGATYGELTTTSGRSARLLPSHSPNAAAWRRPNADSRRPCPGPRCPAPRRRGPPPHGSRSPRSGHDAGATGQQAHSSVPYALPPKGRNRQPGVTRRTPATHPRPVVPLGIPSGAPTRPIGE